MNKNKSCESDQVLSKNKYKPQPIHTIVIQDGVSDGEKKQA